MVASPHVPGARVTAVRLLRPVPFFHLAGAERSPSRVKLKTAKLILLLWWLAVAFPALAHDHITHRAEFEDASAALDFQQIASKTFTPYTGILSRGYSHSALWIRLHVEPGTDHPSEPLVLRIRPGYLDEVRLYDPQYQSLGREVTGDYFPVEQDRYRSLNSNLVIPQGDRPRDIWLRVVSTSTRLIQVQALTQAEALQLDRTQELIYSLYLAAVVFFVIWGVAHWWSWRDRLLQVFALKQAACLVFMLGFLGYARTFWPASLTRVNASDHTDWTFPLYVTLGYLFDYLLLRSFRAPVPGLRLLQALAASSAIYYLLLILGQPRQAFMLYAWVILIEAGLALMLAVSTPRAEACPVSARPLMSRRSLILLYLAVFLGFSLSSLPVLGLAKAEFLVFDGFLVHSLVSGVALFVVMMRRVRDSERQRISAEAARQQAEDRAAGERHRRQEQAAFITMLTHELKTPLAVVRMVLGAKVPTESMKSEAERSIRDMNSIIQRCMQVEQLDERAASKHLRSCCLIEELADLIRSTPEPGRLALHAVELPGIQTDPLLLRMIVANLIDNACKYSPKASPIKVSVTVNRTSGPQRVCIRVANQPGNAGWPDPERVFQKYYRHPRAHEYTGSGLGLFLCNQLAGHLEGQLRYQPAQGEIGFELWIPY